jgi:hypothetical protein
MTTEPKDLTERMDTRADRLLSTAGSFEEELAAFEAVGRWIEIKQGLRGGDQKPKRRGFQDDTREQQRARVNRRWHRARDPASLDGNGGPELEALKARIPRLPDSAGTANHPTETERCADDRVSGRNAGSV